MTFPKCESLVKWLSGRWIKLTTNKYTRHFCMVQLSINMHTPIFGASSCHQKLLLNNAGPKNTCVPTCTTMYWCIKNGSNGKKTYYDISISSSFPCVSNNWINMQCVVIKCVLMFMNIENSSNWISPLPIKRSIKIK